MSTLAPCRVDGCDRRVRKQGLCFAHNSKGEGAVVAPRAPALARDAEGRKRCSACAEWLPLDSFTRDHRGKDGLRGICLSCHRTRRTLAKFNIGPDWFVETFAAQGECCAICKSATPRGRGWAIDHDHACCPGGAESCGRCVRGILCSPCNLALGMVNDQPAVLHSAIGYLTQHAERMSIVMGV